MKSKEQVIRYLSRRSYSNTDWQAILEYCKNNYGSGTRKSIRPVCASTISEFMEWVDGGIGDGDIVACGNTIGIFSDNADGTARIISYNSKGKRFSVTEVTVPIERVRPVYNNDEYYLELGQSGYSYSISLAQICKVPLPPTNKVLRFSSVDGPGVGIVVDVNCGIVKIACCIIGDKLFYDKEYKLTDFDFSKADKKCENDFHEILCRDGMQWNVHTKSLQKALVRADKGKPYWFITDKFSIAREIDNYTKISNARYINYNYFTSYADAAAFREFVFSYRENQIKQNS